MWKKITLTILAAVAVSSAGCSGANVETSKSYTFHVETGDTVRVELDTTGGYDISSDLPFTVSLHGEPLSQGTFITGDAYGQYVEAAKSDPAAQMLDSGTANGNEYVFWSYNGSEYGIAVLISGTDTGVLLGNTVSEDSAWECFGRLEIEAE